MLKLVKMYIDTIVQRFFSTLQEPPNSCFTKVTLNISNPGQGMLR